MCVPRPLCNDLLLICPSDATVSKRPLHRPAIPSPYAGANQQKVVYISSHTPFLSAVKRVEKLLDRADKRLTQAATTNAKKADARLGKRKRSADGDEILGIAEEVERLKGVKRRRGGDGFGFGAAEDGQDEGSAGEGVVLKGTGKAIHRVLELALWFQQREEQYAVRLKTGSVGAVDDIAIDEEGQGDASKAAHADDGEDAVEGPGDTMADATQVDEPRAPTTTAEGPSMEGAGELPAKTKKKKRKRGKEARDTEDVPETRIRYTSVLEVYVSLK